MFDVAVVGAGLAGLNVALALGRMGRRVLLVDRKTTLETGIHTTGIFVRRTLEDFPLPPACLGPAIRHVSLYSPRLRRLDLASPHAEFRVGRMGRLYAARLDECWECGVETALDTHLESISEASDVNVLRLRSGDRTWDARVRYVVGADGAVSRVAPLLGLSRNTEWIVGLEDVYPDSGQSGPPRMHCLLDPSLAPGYIAWAVHDGEEVHVGVGGYARGFEPLQALARWTDMARKNLGLALSDRVERRGGRIPVGGVLPHIGNSRGLLVGDAAGAVSPLTAGGLDPCLRLSGFAAKVLDEALRLGHAAPVVSYSGAMLRRKFRARLWLRGVLRRLGSRGLAEAACWALRTGPGQRLAARVFFEPASFPDVPQWNGELRRWELE